MKPKTKCSNQPRHSIDHQTVKERHKETSKDSAKDHQYEQTYKKNNISIKSSA